MSKYSKETVVNYPVKAAFDAAMIYFPNAGYGMVRWVEPSHIELSRPGEPYSILLPSDEIRREHDLEINMYGYNGTTKMIFNYICPSSIVPYSRRAKEKIDQMTINFASFVQSFIQEQGTKTQSHNVANEERIIERHIVKIRCRHCGSLNDEGMRYCGSCGTLL